MKKVKFLLYSFCLLAVLTFSLVPDASASPTTSTSHDLVVWIPVQEEVEKGLAAFIQRGIAVAEKEGASQVILDMDTPGGAVDAATRIAKLMRETEIPITVFVNKKAISAGAYLALNADTLAMVPGATIGAAAVINASGNTAGKKAESFWLKEMVGAASLNGRDPRYARAMVDENENVPEYGAETGKLLTFTAEQALEVGYADAVVASKQALLKQLNLEGAQVVEVKLSLAERVARLITSSVVVPILLSIGSLGLVLELYTPGFGLPGIAGITSLLLFFYGHLVAGLAGMESIILFIVGLVMILLELFLPGGILGLIGTVAVVGSFLLATDNIGQMITSILIAFIVTMIGSVVMFKIFGLERGVFRRIILSDATSSEKGYVSYDDQAQLLGENGITITPLRPSGTAQFGQERMDVVTEGGYIAVGKPVSVIKVAGGRIIVREEIKEDV